MNYTGPKVKLSRKLGIELTQKSHKYSSKKPYPPGQHGVSKRRIKQSDYGRQLLEKQRLRLQYNISEKQMRNYFAKAARLVGNTGDILVQLLESRLDAFIYRAGLTRSIYASRQLVGHGHIKINGKRVTVPSCQLKANDLVTIKEKTRKNDNIQDSIRSAAPPPYIEISKVDFSAKYLYLPPREEIGVVCDVPLVVEFYSR
ncbi:MAG: 30S ribosomal protein S4 [Ignavibacteria bacterium GWB2_35_12]|nr:MAG: 30S ribosomal protein S4 [Ignavibacteria bacterium GWB2_35_12]OGU93031.1 MAG: 30S ribosomal protein S4 [Ignavibacteria bacterium RIFOXYA2_FULL_35_10]OGV24722.1 MAG: 30S ribosomal protein S4 [Ignavibacteria bacterium RIFOXYC2_FULL_35_21]